MEKKPTQAEILERTYLGLQVLVQREINAGSTTLAIETDSLRGKYRTRLSALTGEFAQQLQERIEAKARVMLLGYDPIGDHEKLIIQLTDASKISDQSIKIANEAFKEIGSLKNTIEENKSRSTQRTIYQLRGPGNDELGLISAPSIVTQEEIERAHSSFVNEVKDDVDNETGFEEFCKEKFPELEVERIFAEEILVLEDLI